MSYINDYYRWFEEYKEVDYARTGNAATKNVVIPEGGLNLFNLSNIYIFANLFL